MLSLLGFVILPGGHSGEVIPVPIPNTEVKLSYADDTAFWRESRQLPGFFFFKSVYTRFFFPIIYKCFSRSTVRVLESGSER